MIILRLPWDLDGDGRKIFLTKVIALKKEDLTFITSFQIIGVGKTYFSMGIKDVLYDIREDARGHFPEKPVILVDLENVPPYQSNLLSPLIELALGRTSTEGRELYKGRALELLKKEGWSDEFSSFGERVDSIIEKKISDFHSRPGL